MNWTLSDFIVMGILFSGFSGVLVLVTKKISKKYRLAASIAVVLSFIYIWAELAVGIFTNWGS